jgi:hypothetical protein
VRDLVRRLWASPASLVGLLVASPCLAFGGTAKVVDGVLEISAERLTRLLRRRGFVGGFRAITFGHVVLATDQGFLEESRAHERVHVRQSEQWGIFFFPLYLLSSLFQLARGKNPYRRNHFERAAFREEGETAVA